MGTLSWLNVETFERVPTPLSDGLVRCSANGRSFARLRYWILKSAQHTMQYIQPLITVCLVSTHSFDTAYCINVTPLSENPALPTTIEFEFKACNFIRTGQLNSDCYTNVYCLHCIILNYDAWLCYYEDDISSNSQAGQRNTGTCYYGIGFLKTRFHQLPVCIRLSFCL